MPNVRIESANKQKCCGLGLMSMGLWIRTKQKLKKSEPRRLVTLMRLSRRKKSCMNPACREIRHAEVFSRDHLSDDDHSVTTGSALIRKFIPEMFIFFLHIFPP
jgi:hypothetical protein